MDMIEFLLSAAEENKELNIIYHGGSKPGEQRKIIPREIDGEFIKAVDTKQRRVKSFSIKKIEVLDDNNEIIPLEFDGNQVAKSLKNSSLQQIYKHYKDTLEGFGWQVAHDFFVNGYLEEMEMIVLHDSFKNGRIKANPSVYLYKSESPHRPFGVGSSRMGTRTYSNLDNALKIFLEEAKNCEIKNPVRK